MSGIGGGGSTGGGAPPPPPMAGSGPGQAAALAAVGVVQFAEHELLRQQQLMDAAQQVLVPMLFVPIALIPCILVLARRWRVYSDYPHVLFKWVLLNDWLYSMFVGPLRWL